MYGDAWRHVRLTLSPFGGTEHIIKYAKLGAKEISVYPAKEEILIT